MINIFSILDKDPNQPLTVEEFVESYVLYEEQLKIKIKKIEKYIDDLSYNKKELENMKKQAEYNEQDIGNGLTNKSYLYITIIEGKDLDTKALTGEINPFVKITFQGNEEKTSVKNNTDNPVYKEVFRFPISHLEEDEKVVIEVLNKTFFGETSLGSISINLNNLIDKDELDNLFELNPGTGKIRMKLNCILNLVKYYDREIKKVTEELENFNDLYEAITVYEDLMKTPFGIIYYPDLGLLLNKERLKQNEQIIDLNFSKKLPNGSEIQERKSEIKRIKWSNVTQLLIICFIASVFFTLLERSNFLDLLLSLSLIILFILDKNSDIQKYLLPLILTFGFSLLYDFIWLVSQFTKFISNNEHPEIKLKRLIYFLCIGNALIKICLIQGLNNVKRKKLNSSIGLPEK